MNILSLTGGGYKGVFSANVLLELEQYMEGERIDTCVDIYAGTSAGSIIAAGLAFGKSADFIHKKFVEYGEEIFPRNWMYRKAPFLRALPFHGPGPGMFKNKYSNKGLRKLLEDIFQGAELRESKKPLIITAVDVESSTPIVMSSYPNKFGYAGLHYENMKVVDAILASTAAPAYFPIVRPEYAREEEYEDDILDFMSAQKTPTDPWLGDGGLAANAPDLLAASEAMTTYGVPFDEINMLSVGTTKVMHALPKKLGFFDIRKRGWGVFQWMVWRKGYLIDVMMHAQVRLAERLLRKIFERDNYIRLDHKLLVKQKIEFDDPSKQDALASLAKDVVEKFMTNDAYEPHRLQIFLDRKSSTDLEY